MTSSPSTVNGVQTLLRGLAAIEAVASGHHDLRAISQYISAPRSTTHRLISALVAQRYLRQISSRGFFSTHHLRQKVSLLNARNDIEAALIIDINAG